VELDVPVFVSEWIKAGVTSFVILLLVEVVSSRRQVHERRARAHDRLEFQFTAALRRMVTRLTELETSAAQGTFSDSDAARDTIRREWNLFHGHVTSEFLIGGPSWDLEPPTIQ